MTIYSITLHLKTGKMWRFWGHQSSWIKIQKLTLDIAASLKSDLAEQQGQPQMYTWSTSFQNSMNNLVENLCNRKIMPRERAEHAHDQLI